MLGLLIVLPLLVQDPPAPPPPRADEEVIAQLLARVQQLEAEVRELKAALPARAAAPATPTVADTSAVAVPPSGAAVPPARAGQPAVPSRASDASPPAIAAQPPEMEMGGGEFPTMKFQGFADVSYYGNDLRSGSNSFALGQFNLFITSNLSPRIAVVAEPVLEADERNAFGFELERLLLQLTASPYFSLSVGRYHTAIGWYNTAYHHSTWLQTAVGRPFLFEFEDKGGILPIHNVGFSATGQIPSGGWRLRWVGEVGNGRASRSPLAEPTQNVRDENNAKAVNLAILAKPDWLSGLQAGFSAYFDRLEPAGQSRIGQTILAGHVVYQAPWLEWLNEGLVIRDAVRDTGRVQYTPGAYTQVSKPFGRWRPYFRYQYLNTPADDPLYADVGRMHGPSVGVRYDFSQFSAFKIQYDRVERTSNSFNGFATQLSFVF